MKKLLLLLAMCCCLNGCTAMLIGAAVGSISPKKFSFKANGERLKATDENLGTFRIIEADGNGFAIAYRGSLWDVDSDIENVLIGLNCGFFSGSLKEDQEYVFTLDDNLDTYPIFRYTETEILESTEASSVSRKNTFWFNAREGWFKITKINKDDGTISGRFAFTAVSDDPASSEEVEITDGVFKNVPYLFIND